MAPQLDHIVLLVPHKYILNPPKWIESNFTVSPGGRHGDGKTENKLIIFPDGSYIELIAFVNDDPAHRQGHWWDKPFGLVDYALTSQTADPDSELAQVRARLDALHGGQDVLDPPVTYVEPKQGSRLREDGERISWKVTFPSGVARGEVPFWCYDTTPRERRVPTDAAATSHPCGAVGVAQITSVVPAHKAQAFDKAFEAVVGTPAVDRDGEKVFVVDSVSAVGASGPRLLLRKPVDNTEAAAVGERGALIADIVLKVKKIDGQSEIAGTVGDTKQRITFEEVAK